MSSGSPCPLGRRGLDGRLDLSLLAGDEVVDDADAVAAPQKLLDEMRADEARAAGDEVARHRSDYTERPRDALNMGPAPGNRESAAAGL